MTLLEFCTQHKNDKETYWLCPNICSNQNITPRKYEYGMEFVSSGFIPKELLDKELVKAFREDGKYCLIWRNE